MFVAIDDKAPLTPRMLSYAACVPLDTVQNTSCGKVGKKNSVIDLPYLNCLAKLLRIEATPSGL